MRIEARCPFCGKVVCKMEKDSDIEIRCRNCKAVFVLKMVEPPKLPQHPASPP